MPNYFFTVPKPVFDRQIVTSRNLPSVMPGVFSPGRGQRTLTTEPKSIPLKANYEADPPDDRAVISDRVQHD
jgi:hypothetical protein